MLYASDRNETFQFLGLPSENGEGNIDMYISYEIFFYESCNDVVISCFEKLVDTFLMKDIAFYIGLPILVFDTLDE